MGNHFDHWRRTLKLKTFERLSDYEEWEKDCCRLPPIDIDMKRIASMKKSNIKKGIVDGERFDSMWEAAYYIWARDVKGYSIIRNKSDFLTYIDALGKQRKFFPDFKCNNEFVEVKGRWRESDTMKQEQNPEVKFVTSPEINEIIKEVEQKFPNWRQRYMVVN